MFDPPWSKVSSNSRRYFPTYYSSDVNGCHNSDAIEQQPPLRLRQHRAERLRRRLNLFFCQSNRVHGANPSRSFNFPCLGFEINLRARPNRWNPRRRAAVENLGTFSDAKLATCADIRIDIDRRNAISRRSMFGRRRDHLPKTVLDSQMLLSPKAIHNQLRTRSRIFSHRWHRSSPIQSTKSLLPSVAKKSPSKQLSASKNG
jgi:hypothetical protein